LDTASNASLENEFGTHKEDDVVKAIIEKGTVQDAEVRHPLISTYTWKCFPYATTLDGNVANESHRTRSAPATETLPRVVAR
jgi:hypothetical protein